MPRPIVTGPLILTLTVCLSTNALADAKQINGLLVQAMSAAEKKIADAKLDQAQKLVASTMTGDTKQLFQGDILRYRGRVAVRFWQLKTDDEELRAEAVAHLTDAIDQYDGFFKKYEARAEQIAKALRDADPNADPRKNSQWRMALGAASRAAYAMAWSRYSRGLVSPDEKKKEEFDTAIDQFEAFTANGYRNVPIVADCFLGQALCYFEQSQYDDVNDLLKEVTANNCPAVTWRKIVYLRMRSYQKKKSFNRVEEVAKTYFDALSSDKLDSTELKMALDRARNLMVLTSAGNSALTQTYKRRLRSLGTLVGKQGSNWQTRFELITGATTGVSAMTSLVKARQAFTAGNFDQALTQIDIGIKAKNQKTDPAVVSDLYWMKAATLWNLKRWRDAYTTSLSFVDAWPKDRRAPAMMQRAIQSTIQSQHGDKDARVSDDEIEKLLARLQSPPDNDAIKRAAPWLRAKLFLELERFDEAETILRSIDSTSPLFGRAQYGMAYSALKRSDRIADKPAQRRARTRLLDRAANAISQSMKASATTLKEELSLAPAIVDVALGVAQRLLELPRPDTARVLGMVDSIDNWNGTGEHAADARLSLRIGALAQAGDTNAVTQLIRQGLAQSSGAALAKALTNVVDSLESRHQDLVDSGKKSDAAVMAKMLGDVYQFLVKQAAESDDEKLRAVEITLRKRLANNLLQHQNRLEEGLEHYQSLAKIIDPRKHGDVIRGLALAYERSGQFEPALDQWRTLATGLSRNTDHWFESKYHVIVCYIKTNKLEHARNLLKYVMLQYPKIRVGDWQLKFDQLAQQLGDGDGG